MYQQETSVHEVVAFLINGEECQPFCDICGESQEDVGKIVNYDLRTDDDFALTLCSGCKSKVIDILNTEPLTKVNIDMESGELLVNSYT